MLPDGSQTQVGQLQTPVAERIPDLRDHRPFPSGTCESDASAGALQEPFQAVSQDLQDRPRSCRQLPDHPDIQGGDAEKLACDSLQPEAEEQCT